MARINSRQKGKRGEREAAAELRRLFGCDARRSQQYNGAGKVGDVDGLPGVHVEVKRRKGLNVYAAVAQAVADAPAGSLPVVLYRGDSTNGHDAKPWLVIMPLDDLPALAARLAALEPASDDPTDDPRETPHGELH